VKYTALSRECGGHKDNDTALAVKDLAIAVHESLRLICEILEKLSSERGKETMSTTFNYSDREKMTFAQRMVMDTFYALRALETEATLCIDQIRKAESAVVSLPHMNEWGNSVIHASNMHVQNVASYWTARLNALERMVDRETFQKITGYRNSPEAYTAIRNECEKARNAKT
jgi:hypothetical protein